MEPTNMIYEIPKQPAGLGICWVFLGSDEGWVEFELVKMRFSSAHMWRRTDPDVPKVGPGVWLNWSTLLQMGPISDVKPVAPNVPTIPQVTG